MSARTDRCSECGRSITITPDGIEVGHERGRSATGISERCSRRPASVDPSGGPDHDGWCSDHSNIWTFGSDEGDQ